VGLSFRLKYVSQVVRVNAGRGFRVRLSRNKHQIARK